MLLSDTFLLQLYLNKVLSKFFMPQTLKRSEALSWNDKQLARLYDKPDPRPFLARKPPYSRAPSYCKYSLIPCFTSPLWADSSEAVRLCLCRRQKDGALLLRPAPGGLPGLFFFGVWRQPECVRVCKNNNHSCGYKRNIYLHILQHIL